MKMYVIGLAFGALASAFKGAARSVVKVLDPVGLYRSLRAFECQSVGMTRLKATLAQWRTNHQEKRDVLRADMRASGNGAVFNTMQRPILISDPC